MYPLKALKALCTRPVVSNFAPDPMLLLLPASSSVCVSVPGENKPTLRALSYFVLPIDSTRKTQTTQCPPHTHPSATGQRKDSLDARLLPPATRHAHPGNRSHDLVVARPTLRQVE